MVFLMSMWTTGREHFEQRGSFERRIMSCGFIGGPENTSTGEDRLAGFIDGLAEFGTALPNNLRRSATSRKAAGIQCELLDHSPDAVFAASDGMALGAIRRIQDAGLSIPQTLR